MITSFWKTAYRLRERAIDLRLLQPPRFRDDDELWGLMQRDKYVRLHEAGHAVVAYSTGQTLFGVVFARLTSGVVGAAKYDVAEDPDPERVGPRMAAGEVAVRVALRARPYRVLLVQNDLIALQRGASYDGRDPNQVVAEYSSAAYRILRPNFPIVLALARWLRRRDVTQGSDVYGFLRSAGAVTASGATAGEGRTCDLGALAQTLRRAGQSR
ncbi:MAG: hypothetical protein ACE37F_35895 [Nannocystaceae bacterium]|nr:hypothetical protein [bacterium]